MLPIISPEVLLDRFILKFSKKTVAPHAPFLVIFSSWGIKMKFIIATFFMLFSVLAQAQISIHDAGRAGFDKLSETEKAAIIQQIAEKNSNNVPIVGNITPEKLDQFAQTGANIGKGLAAAAKEIGVAVNEFVQTPVGILTVGLIAWQDRKSVV